MPRMRIDELEQEADAAANDLWHDPKAQDQKENKWQVPSEDEVNAQFETERRPGFNAEYQKQIDAQHYAQSKARDEAARRARIEVQLRTYPARKITRPLVKGSLAQQQRALLLGLRPQIKVQWQAPFEAARQAPGEDELRDHVEAEYQRQIEAERVRRAQQLRDRFNTAGIDLPDQRPNNDVERKEYYGNYARLVREEAVRGAVERMFNPPLARVGATSLNDEFQRVADRWLGGVRAHDEWSGSPLFNPKPRGHGQVAGSTDGRLLRKLMMAATQEAVTSNPHFAPYRDEITAAGNRLNAVERALKKDPGNVRLQQNHTYAKQELSNQSQRLNEEVARGLDALLSQPGGHSALRKAIFLTKEKLRDPLGYKQKYARVVPFDDPNKWVKASRRFYIPANKELLLPDRTTGKDRKRKTAVVHMGTPPDNLPPFGSGEPIDDVGQTDLSDCWLLASAASQPPETLQKMFSDRPSYKSEGVPIKGEGVPIKGEGVTTRLHDEQGKPIYIRTPKDQLWHNAAAHKVLWPYVLESAAAKVGRNDLRDFHRKMGFDSREPNSGLKTFSVRSLIGNSINEAANLSTGKPPLVYGKFSDPTRDLLQEAEQKRVGKGVATFPDPQLMETRNHAMTLLGWNRSSGRGKVGNPWASGSKSSWIDLARKVEDLGFLDPKGADPANDKFVSPPDSVSLPPEEYQEQRIGRIGNLFTRPR